MQGFGEFKYDLRHGNGVMRYTNGDEYSGVWQYNAKQGDGVVVYGDGRERYRLNKPIFKTLTQSLSER
eukprot:gene23489-29707_t